MTKSQLMQLAALRSEGLTAAEIAKELGVPDGTVRSYIRRHPDAPFEGGCKYCGAHLTNLPGKRSKTFCSMACKNAYWNNRRSSNAPVHKCEYCGKEFRSYESDNRKYCSQKCYRAARYNG